VYAALSAGINQYDMERVTGIEPAYFAWEANVLPLNYTRIEAGSCPSGWRIGFSVPKMPVEPL
jgi:hypothetical protein